MVVAIVAALSFFWWLIFVVAWVLFLFFTVTIARMKGRSAILWGILACFFPLITIVVLLLLPDRSSD
jgi:hypothetical protein